MIDRYERQHNTVFESTLSGLEAGLKVRHIASYDLITCDVGELVSAVFDSQRVPDSIDQVPVLREGRVVGILERPTPLPDGIVADHMRLLDDSILVSGDEPLSRFLLETFQGPYRIVVDGVKIDGIVTWADVLKLPVRLLAFTLVTHLESLMAQIITAHYPDDDGWVKLLNKPRREKLFEALNQRREEGNDPSLLELTYLTDKATVVRRVLRKTQKFTSEMGSIEKLRNAVAHSRDYVDDDQSLEAFVRRLRLTQTWVADLSSSVSKSDRPTVAPLP